MTKFAQILESRNLTISKVSKSTGVPYTTLSEWKRGIRIPKINTVQKVAEFLELPVDYLAEMDITIDTPEKISARDQRDLDKFLQQTDIMFDGELHHLDDEGRQLLRDALKYAFWQAKEKNKRKPKK